MIRFDQVTKSYSGTARPALNNLSLEVQGGEFVFLVGASGSGKSSFLRLVLKEERPTKGNIYVLGQHLNTLASRKVPFFRRNLGVVFQDFRLLPQKTVFDNVAFSLQVIGKSKGFIQEAVPDVLRLVGLAGKQGRYPHELSGGEQQRVAIARAIVNKPSILLADEPTGNLDPATSAGIMSLLSTINANGTTILMATHDVGIVDQMRRRVIELVGGQVVRDERSGGYQTQAMPTARSAAAAPSASAAASAATAATPAASRPAASPAASSPAASRPGPAAPAPSRSAAAPAASRPATPPRDEMQEKRGLAPASAGPGNAKPAGSPAFGDKPAGERFREEGADAPPASPSTAPEEADPLRSAPPLIPSPPPSDPGSPPPLNEPEVRR
ncbi:MAG: cell division ATP-binding protein FtsE [Leifsonia sp.]|nr:cell division ATP-binding protein FtsE [Leifsonia sp.]|tara:strand:- start:42548 stop:43699 length:1152 start_codon:yes stop_codon:yes gene_type:complete